MTPETSLADEVVERAVLPQQESSAAAVQQLIEAAYRVIAETGDFAPPVRSILAEAGLSNPTFYRHFRSKDELLMVMLDDGRRRLATYLEHRTDAATGRDEKVAEWVRGVLAQAQNADSARRTRPFLTNVARLQEAFPEEQARSEHQLIEQLAVLLDDEQEWATTIYTLAFGALGRSLQAESSPTDDEVDALVRFVLAGLCA